MRCFYLAARDIARGPTGESVAAEGVHFNDGTAVVRTLGANATTTIHASLASVKDVHLKDGHALVWVNHA